MRSKFRNEFLNSNIDIISALRFTVRRQQALTLIILINLEKG